MIKIKLIIQQFCKFRKKSVFSNKMFTRRNVILNMLTIHYLYLGDCNPAVVLHKTHQRSSLFFSKGTKFLICGLADKSENNTNSRPKHPYYL